ncbi:MAG: hypothetical protein ABFS46_10060 [Myxococcota bacterium]
MILSRAFGVTVAVLLALTSPAPAADTDPTPWNQEEVTAIAEQLKQATQELYDSFYKQPTQNIGSGQARAYQQLKHTLRRIRTESQHLAATLTKGEGHDETRPIYGNLMGEVRNAQEDARKVFSTSPVIERANAVRAILEKLSAYYEA